ncbi:hypothetical protein phiGT1_46 [Sulfitobacter phage phiGT1]|nr:hypothetical protein phiGT1_46 [Sulfitobacter phage phiGT1]
MNMIEQIKHDLNASYDKGPWSAYEGEYQWFVRTQGPYPVCSIDGCDYKLRARRIARVPDMEAALISVFESLDILDSSVNVERRGAVHFIREHLEAAIGAT